MYMCNAAMLSCDFKDLQAWPEITVSSNITNAVVRVKCKKKWLASIKLTVRIK